MNAINCPGGVVIGSDFQALGVVRCLQAHSLPVFLVEYERGIARYSRFSRRRAMKSDLFTSADGARFLLDLAARESLDGWVLYPNSDEAVKFLSLHRDELGQAFRVPVPNWDITQHFYHKDRAYRLAAEHGIAIPRQYEADNLSQLMESDLQFPIVLKPSFKENYYEKTRKKAIRVDSRDELCREYDRMAQLIPASQIVVQEMVTGGPANLYSYVTVFGHGRPLAGMTARRSRQHPMDFGHATTFAESVEIPEIVDLATRFLQALNYEGVAELEFMYDGRSSEYKFIEMNGRIWGWHTLARAAGVNIPLALYEHLVHDCVAPSQARPGVKWIRLATDAPTVAAEIIRGRLSPREWLRSLRGEREYAVLSASDPLPFLMESILLPYLWWKKGF